MVQLTGTKEISLLKPSEESKLQYQDMLDVQHGIGAVINGCIIGYVICIFVYKYNIYIYRYSISIGIVYLVELLYVCVILDIFRCMSNNTEAQFLNFVQEVVDAEPHVDDVFADGPAALGDLKHLERRSRGATAQRSGSEFDV